MVNRIERHTFTYQFAVQNDRICTPGFSFFNMSWKVPHYIQNWRTCIYWNL